MAHDTERVSMTLNLSKEVILILDKLKKNMEQHQERVLSNCFTRLDWSED